MKRRSISLTINGQPFSADDVPEHMPTVAFLHEVVGLTGTKYGCGVGSCRACTVLEVLADGSLKPVRSCVTPISYFEGKQIMTIEGHADAEQLTALQEAFLDEFAFQCGYCTSGFLNGASALIDDLKRHPVKEAELDERIKDAVGEHICRCTGYVRYYRAIRKVVMNTPGLIA